MVIEENGHAGSQTEASNLIDSLIGLWRSLPDNIQLDCRYVLINAANSIEEEGL